MNKLPQGWGKISFGDLNCYRQYTVNPSSFSEEIFELYSVPAFPSNEPEILIGGAIGSTKQIVNAEDVLVCKINPRINRVWQVKEKKMARQIASSEWIVMRAPEIDAGYLAYYFSSPEFREQICKDVTGVGGSLTRAQPKRVSSFNIPICSKNQQKRISDKLEAILDRVDACRKHLDRIPAILKRFRQSVLSVATLGNFNELAISYESCAGKIRFVKLSKIIEEIITGPFGSALHKSDYVTDQIPIINPMHINGGVIVPTSEMTVTAQKASELKKFQLREGDVIVARRGVMGRCAVVKAEQIGWLCGTGSLILRPAANIDPEYLRLFLSSPEIVSTITANAVGSTMVNLNQRILLSLPIQLPTLEIQKRIVSQVEKLFLYINRLESEYEEACNKINHLTPTILGKAFRGELVPQDPNDEPASLLLERIQAARAVAPAKKRGKRGAGRPKKIRKPENIMLQRHEIEHKHLTTILKERGPLTAEALWSASQLEIDDFYDQLKVEEAQGLLREQHSDAGDISRQLEAAP